MALALNALYVFFLLTVVKVAFGIDAGDVDGFLGHGQRFDTDTVEVERVYTGIPRNIEDGTECCYECKKAAADTEMVDYFRSFESREHFCSCMKRKPTGERPATNENRNFVGFCGEQLVKVDGSLGEGKSFYSDSVDRLRTIEHWDLSVPQMTHDKCCQECKKRVESFHTEMFEYETMYVNYKHCKCFKTIPGVTPITVTKEHFADVCGKTSDPKLEAFSKINKEDCYDINTDYPGNDIDQPDLTTRTDFKLGTVKYKTKSTAASCQYLCSITEGCNYFTWSSTNSRCYLKKSKSEKTSEEGAISGPKNC